MSFRKSKRQVAKERREARGPVLEVLCRVFDDGADSGMEEWERWYDPRQWFNWSRALGAFISLRLAREPAYQRGVREGLEHAVRLINAAKELQMWPTGGDHD